MTCCIEDVLEKHGYSFVRSIGRGGFASVFLVHSSKYGRNFAAKVTRMVDKAVQYAEAEIENLKQLAHPNIILLYDHFVEGNELYLILEYCPSGSLKDHISPGNPLSMNVFRSVCTQILSALCACHDKGIAHRDIKPENVLIDSHGRPKLADFGLGVFCVKGNYVNCDAGSLVFAPPEFFKEKSIDPFKADVWSVGLLFLTLATGRLPWRGSKLGDFIEEISRCDIGHEICDLPYDVRQLISLAMTVDPLVRPTAHRLMELPFCRKSPTMTPSISSGAMTRSLAILLNQQGEKEATKSAPHVPECAVFTSRRRMRPLSFVTCSKRYDAIPTARQTSTFEEAC